MRPRTGNPTSRGDRLGSEIVLSISDMNMNNVPHVEPKPVAFQEVWATGWIQSVILAGAVLGAVAYAYLVPLQG
jgi:hypothetical protein